MHDVAYIALGSNLGDRDAELARARKAISTLPDTRIVGESTIEETQPIGPAQPWFLNQMIAVETSMTPHQLLRALQAIEQQAGRTRGKRWGPRTLDLDIVCFGHQSVHEPDLWVDLKLVVYG